MKSDIKKYLAAIGAQGGAKGGLAKGKRKRRSPEHYARMVEARRLKREARKADA